MKKIFIISWKHLDNAYSCILYLKMMMEKKTSVELWSRTDASLVDARYRNNMHNFCDQWYGRVKKVRNIIAQWHIFFKALRSGECVYIINDWDFLVPLFYAKKINKSLKVIHYCTEIPGRDCFCLPQIERFYSKHANYPDLIIECLYERAKWRKEKYDIQQKIFTINNTLPLMDVKTNDINDSYKQYLSFEKDLPVLIYAGGASLSRQIKEIVDCVDQFYNKVNFCFFCYGNRKEFEDLHNYYKKKCHGNNSHLYKAIPRKELLAVMKHCDIGINYYIPDYSINHKYAAPGKIFEYMACGLNIISTNNEGINHIIIDNNIGVCLNNNETVSNGLQRLLDHGLCEKSMIRKLFREKYCYEKDSVEALNAILKLL